MNPEELRNLLVGADVLKKSAFWTKLAHSHPQPYCAGLGVGEVTQDAPAYQDAPPGL